MMIHRPLEGIRVVDFGQFVAAPGASQSLVSLGADVIKVEPREGDWVRSGTSFGEAILRTYNRGKRSIALDLKDSRGLGVAERLVSDADVVIQNMRPGAMEALGLGPDRVNVLNPRAIYATVSGFGLRGPSRHRPGLDIAAQAESGLMSITGELGGTPLRVGTTIVDAATAHVLTEAILAALLERERFGRVAAVEVSLLEVALHLQSADWTGYSVTGSSPCRRGNGQPGVAPAADLIETSDGYIVLSGYSAQHWPRLCEVLGRVDLAGDPRFADNEARVAHREELLTELSVALGGRTSEECVQLLASNGIVVGAVRTYDQVRESDDVIAGEMFTCGEHFDGSAFDVVQTPFRLGGDSDRTARRVPRLGEHSGEIVTGIGYSAAELDELVEAGVLLIEEPSSVGTPA
ncbi:CaiB/BaiF CoA transferase family protein [Rhodococcus wratislaviensis]|uniref:CaiB/BaiF CoA transferase family protein n=1 Tax=Rhodococcus wratislaviensis TaxID=44752 RepID=UPI0036627439